VVQQLTGVVRNDIPGAMPGFTPEQISDADVAALVDYLLDEADRTAPPQQNSFYAALAPVGPVANTADRTYFPQTRHTVSGAFKQFFEANGGVAIFGYPISQEYIGISEQDGQAYTMQMFERARFEYHPELADKGGNAVLLGLLGSEQRAFRTHFLMERMTTGGD
jgi:hypothetical protein